MGKFGGQISVGIQPAQIAGVAITTLRRFGWDQPFVNNELRTITAPMVKRDNIMGTPWQFNFLVWLGWQIQDEGCLVELHVTENSYDWSDEQCKSNFDRLSAGLIEDANRWQLQPAEKDSSGSRWATEQQMKDADYLASPDCSVRLLLGRLKQQVVSMPEGDTYRHTFVCGPTGAGKTSGIFIPNLIERTGSSAIVTEATGSKGRADLFSKTSGFRAKAGHVIYFFNADSLKSDRVNPLDIVNTYMDARRITEVIMQSTTLGTHRGDQTWEQSERLLLLSLILHAVGHRQTGKCNLGYVRDLLYLGAEKLRTVLADTSIEEAHEAYEGFVNNTTEAYRSLVAQGLVTRLALWGDPRIRELTSCTDIDLPNLHQTLFTWYIATPADKPELKPLAALIFNVALNVAGQGNFRYPISLYLDELPNFGYVRGLPQKLTILRHDKIPVMLGAQDFVQIELLYGKEAALFLSQPGTKIFFRPNDLTTAQNISRALGIAETIENQVTSAAHIHENKDKKPLLSVEELLSLNPQEIVVFSPSIPPLKLTALNWQDYQSQTDEDAYPPPQKGELAVIEGLTKRKKPGQKACKDLGASVVDDDPLAVLAEKAEEPETDRASADDLVGGWT